MNYSDDEMEEMVALALTLLDRFTAVERMLFRSSLHAVMKVKFGEAQGDGRARVVKEVKRQIRRAEKRKRQLVRPKAVKHS